MGLFWSLIIRYLSCACLTVIAIQTCSLAVAQTSTQDSEPESIQTPEDNKSELPLKEIATGDPQNEGATKPNQLDERLIELLSLITDNSTKMLKREMPAYWALVDRVMDKSVGELTEYSRKNPRFNDFYSNPAGHRGELISTTINIRRVISYPVDPALGHRAEQLYELWGWTDEAKAWVYCIVTPSLPKDFPTDGEVNEKVNLSGYFFKLQGYQPGVAAPNSRPLLAPMIIGKIEPAITPISPPSQTNNIILLFVALFAVVIILRLLVRLRFSAFSSRPAHLELRRRLQKHSTDWLDGLSFDEKDGDKKEP